MKAKKAIQRIHGVLLKTPKDLLKRNKSKKSLMNPLRQCKIIDYIE